MTAPNHKPLTVTLDAWWGEVLRDFAQVQGCTYKSAVSACIQAMLKAGGPTVLEPYGEPLACDNNQPTSAHLQVILSDGGINDR